MAEKRSAGAAGPESKKKARRDQKYRDVWEKEFPWLRPSTKDACKALCTKCGVEITAQLTTIKLHEKSGKHQSMCATSTSTKTIAEAFATAHAHTSKGDSVKAAEIKLTAMMVILVSIVRFVIFFISIKNDDLVFFKIRLKFDIFVET